MSSNNCRVILYLIYLWINLIERYRCEMVGDGSVQIHMTRAQRSQMWRYIKFYLPLVAEPATTTRLPLRVRAFVWVR